MTYQQGLAPADAPVTWEYNDPVGNFAALYGIRVKGREVVTIVLQVVADYLCHAAHLAALAEEMREMVRGAPLCPPGTKAWSDRVDAAKGAT